MASASLHGYIDPSLPPLDGDTIKELNLHAAKDLARRSIPGGVIVLLALLISSGASPLANEFCTLSCTLLTLMTIIVLIRFYTIYLMLKDKIALQTSRILTFVIFFVNASIWGIYVGASLYLYGDSTMNMVILMFTIGIGAGAVTSLFIWNGLAQIYLLLIFLPSMITTVIHWQITTTSILFGLAAYFIFLIVQARRANTEYWRALCINKLLHHQTDQLREAKDQAEKANQAKTAFLSSMSHELRTPLNAIFGFTQLIHSDQKSPPTSEQKEGLNHILKASNHLLTLINQVLDLAKIESGKLDLNIGAVDVSKVLNECLPLIQSLAKEKEIKLMIAEMHANTFVMADPMRLKQVFINLLTNGIKYNHNGGLLKVDFDLKDKQLSVKITDTGIGISPFHQKRMFQSFSRLGQENSSTEGSGVGLVITKSLLEAMGGKLGFSSVEGQGSCFWFELPLCND